MHILIYGNDAVDYCSEVHHAKTLMALDHSVTLLNEQKIQTDEILKYDIDIFIWIHSHGFINRGTDMKQILSILKDRGVPTIAYHLDLYMGLERWKEYEKSSYMNNLQYFFTVDRLMADWLNKFSNTRSYYIPAGVFHEECYSLDLPKKYDVVFVGSKGYHKEWKYRPELIEWLKDTYKDRFFHFGGDGLGVVRGHELNKVYAQSKVVIGDTLCPNFIYPYYFSDRLFESVGRGAFTIFPYIKGIEEMYNNDELITYTYNDLEELRSKIDYYLHNETERAKIQKRGFERTKKDHTYIKRWIEILKIIKENEGNNN